jgi:hypothetical protein
MRVEEAFPRRARAGHGEAETAAPPAQPTLCKGYYHVSIAYAKAPELAGQKTGAFKTTGATT